MDKITTLQTQILLLSTNSAELDSIRKEFLEKLNSTQASLTEKNAELECTQRQLLKFKTEADESVVKIQEMEQLLQHEGSQIVALRQEMADLRLEQATLEKENSAIINEEKSKLSAILEQKDRWV